MAVSWIVWVSRCGLAQVFRAEVDSVFLRELEVEDLNVLGELSVVIGTRDRNDSLFDVPSQQDLRRGLSVTGSHRANIWVRQQRAASSKRAPRLSLDAVGPVESSLFYVGDVNA